jgi:acetylglutamate kinase
MLNTQEVITKLLRNLGSRKEVEQYLKQFSSVESQRFAVIRVSGAVIQRDLDSLVSSLTFLHTVGLTPLVVHGAGPQLDDALAVLGIKTARKDGLRVTPREALDTVKKVMQRENLRLVDALEKLGTRARPISTGVFEAVAVDEEKLGLVGQVSQVHVESVMSSIRAGHMPIIASLGETTGGQILNINSVVATRALAHAVEPFKVIFLTEAGGMLDAQGQVISAINLVEDHDMLMEQSWLTENARLKLQEVKVILDRLPPTSSVSITSPDHLARELFTHKGSGTLVRQGDRVRVYESLEGVDQPRLANLLETCFGRPLKPNYFEVKKFFRIYLADSYRATAIITRETDIPYLDKFAVTQEAQGVGVGGSIWRRMVQENPRLFWRARKDNPVNPWYFENAQGSYKSDKWTVFWLGLDNFDQAKECIEHALALPATLADHSVQGV